MLDLDAIRADLPALAALAYLNTGTEGPLPAPVATAMREAMDEDERRGRISPKRFEKMHQQLDECRALMGTMVGAPAERVVLTGGTVDGVRVVLERLGLKAGDRVVTTSLEHPAALEPLHQFVRRRGVVLDTVVIAPTADDDEIVADFSRALADRPRLLLVSHVSYASGRRLPVAAISRLAREAGALVLLDGAQAVGGIVVDLAATGADFCAFPGQKWLLGPEGAGALAFAPDALSRIADTAEELERGTASKPVWAGMRAALAWRRAVGPESELVARIAANAERLRSALARLPGVEVITPRDAAGLVTFAVTGTSAGSVIARLGARRLAVRDVPETDWVRVSCGFFTSEAELAALVDTVAEVTRLDGGQTT